MTSFDVIAYLRGVLKTRKIGHSGTLDPDAAGVLPVFVGHATKVIEYAAHDDKQYRAELVLGISTDTQDSTGNVIRVEKADVSPEEIAKAVSSFRGKILQTPPMYSAVKIGGRKLYELAREGRSVERQPREVEIHSAEIVSIRDSRVVLLDVTCSKGTYIRTLCADIGDSLGCGAHMSFLLRRRAGIFELSSALTLEEIAQEAGNNRLEEKFLDAGAILTGYRKLTVEDIPAKKLMSGGFIPAPSGFEEDDRVRLYAAGERFFALGRVIDREGVRLIKPDKVFEG